MKAAKPATTTPSAGILFIALLAAVLIVIFGKSFLADYVQFSNDGPLGQENTRWLQLPAGFTGGWADLNDVGGNAGSFPLGLTALFKWALGPVDFSKFFVPIALFILGFGAWTFFRQLKLSLLAAALGAIAATLNSSFFAGACWGVGSQEIAVGMDFFALALVISNVPETPALVRWIRLALAGMAVGVNVIEAADIGAIFSLFVAAFVFFKTLADEGRPILPKLGRGIGQVAIIAVFAGFIATQTVVALVGSQIQGIAGTAQDAETKLKNWDWATQWSEPKMETLGLFVPGLFGYRTDTPKDMMEFLQDAYKGGNYWGGVGRSPEIDRYFDSGQKDSPPPGMMRFTGGQNYCGILVVLVALWAVAQSLRRQNSVFPGAQRRLIWFWAAVLIGSLLLAWGRFAPFFKLAYLLPYASTIRNPTKFLYLFSFAIVILFAYGIHALSRRYLGTPAANSKLPPAQPPNRRGQSSSFDQKWIWFCAIIGSVSILAWLIYASEKTSFVHYLQTVGFGNEDMAQQIATFSIAQAGWFIVLFAAAAGLLALVLTGFFAGKRIKLAGVLLGAFLLADFGRADLPYIIHWNYKQKYDIDPANPAHSTNPIINFLLEKPYEYRVAYGLPWPLSTPSQFGLFDQLYRIEWMQHHFPYYNIQSLDVVQRPRTATDLAAFEGAFRIGVHQDSSGQWGVDPTTFPRVTRLWELTDTRYLLGPVALMDLFNGQFDPAQHRFRIIATFNVIPKNNVPLPPNLTREQMDQVTHMLPPDELTAMPAEDGQYALFEFTGALPRAKLYSNWQISTNDPATLQTLVSTNFDPWNTVLVSSPLPAAPVLDAKNKNSGTVEFKSYAPKDIKFDAKAGAPSVLLLNDKYDATWRVFVDGKPAELLRCNFIMRGVAVSPGPHTVEFKFSLPRGPLYVTLTAMGVALLLCGGLFVLTRRRLGIPAQL